MFAILPMKLFTQKLLKVQINLIRKPTDKYPFKTRQELKNLETCESSRRFANWIVQEKFHNTLNMAALRNSKKMIRLAGFEISNCLSSLKEYRGRIRRKTAKFKKYFNKVNINKGNFKTFDIKLQMSQTIFKTSP